METETSIEDMANTWEVYVGAAQVISTNGESNSVKLTETDTRPSDVIVYHMRIRKEIPAGMPVEEIKRWIRG